MSRIPHERPRTSDSPIALALVAGTGVLGALMAGGMVILAVVAIAALLGTAGCTSYTAMHGRDADIPATFSFCTLKAGLPPEISPLAARAAAESALRARGYIVTDSGGTKDCAYVTARIYPDRLGESTTATARSSARGTCLEIDPGFGGDEASTRVVLDAILARLGR